MTFANRADVQHEAIGELGDRSLSVSGGRLALFSTVPLDEPRPGPNEAVIVVHGALRNAGDYYRSIRPGRRRLVVAPQFLTEDDVRADEARARYLHWGTEEWKGGLGEVSSFTVMDELLQSVAAFPDVRHVTIVGNSAGGQFVNRYAAVGRGPDHIGASVRFVVANPSTYLYFDRQRPKGDSFVDHDDLDVDQWRYGFGGGVPDYVGEATSGQEYFDRYAQRDVVYLLGEQDADPGALLLEVHPAAEAQGRTRRERGENYHRYLRHKAGRPVHTLVHVPRVGHDAAAMFASPQAGPYLFERRR